MVEEKKSLEDLKELKKNDEVVDQVTSEKTDVSPVKDDLGRSYATGKRKDAVARVWLKKGAGVVLVNGKDMSKYFARPVLQMLVNQPFSVAKVEGEFENHITFYLEKDVYNGVYLKGGLSSVDVISNESLGTGSTYGDDRILGYTLGVGYRYDLDTMFIKLEASMTDYETIELSATNTSNTATGDVDATTGKISVGYKF